MQKMFSPRVRITYWRKLWLWLAETEQELGLSDISDEAIAQMKAHLIPNDQDFKVAAIEERERRHDGQQCHSMIAARREVDRMG